MTSAPKQQAFYQQIATKITKPTKNPSPNNLPNHATPPNVGREKYPVPSHYP